ncbi:kinase-like protein [Lepidopterella palustris CBS 459.81]|uniref:Kinase-like protein n=1 Tax=Lepidopterella palustris CBS 459.81 TaxID=1314670 RepID=A0A8E2DWN2_9PEZI|nr:kinase-like protein [Lepidopterella palustris CBS 459.81]
MRDSITASEGETVPTDGEAAKFNSMILRKLQKAFAEDPEVDLLSKFPSKYSIRLAEKKAFSSDQSEHDVISPKRRKIESPQHVFDENDARSHIRASDDAITPFPLSETLKAVLGNGPKLSESITRLLAQAEPLFSSFTSSMVLKLNAAIAVKIVHGEADLTEYRTIQFLETHISGDFCPKPLGLVRLSGYNLMFMSYVPGKSLDKTWPTLNEEQKISLRDQLDKILVELRSLPCPEGTLLGGLDGHGCKDMRRQLRRNLEPITHHKEFEDFLFSKPHFGSRVYIEFIRSLFPSDHNPRCVFTHGDLRLENIIVDINPNGWPTIAGIVDWEVSGFYPEYWESLKVTNCLATNERSDWYFYLPKSISPSRYPVQWLLDRIWDKHIE